VWVLVWEIEVVARKVIREVPRETEIPRMWVLEGVVVPAHRARTGPSGAGVSSHTPRTPVQQTRGRGGCGEWGS